MQCGRTGIEFDALSKRQKNHPAISSFLSEQARYPNRYKAAAEACGAIKEAAGAMTIEEALELLRMAVASAEKDEASRRSEFKARIEEAKQRKRTNELLRSHGYKWVYHDGESLDAFSPDGVGLEHLMGWNLVAPSGEVVSIQQAKQRILAGEANA